MRNVVTVRLAVVVVVAGLAAAVWGDLYIATETEEAVMTVHYLDVDQGDATLLESPSGVQVLIDGGRDASVLRELSAAMGFWDRTIDVVVATHPDADHVAGLVDVLERYEVSTVVLTENKSITPAAVAFAGVVEKEGVEVVYARQGQVVNLGAGAQLHVLFPDRTVEALESNTSSIVAQLHYGETSFLFTGDAPKSIEAYLLDVYGSALESEVLKVGHHGSKTSTAEAFVTAVAPAYAVISAGCDNRYGHPHQEVLDKLVSTEVLETCESGTVVFTSNGQEVVRTP